MSTSMKEDYMQMTHNNLLSIEGLAIAIEKLSLDAAGEASNDEYHQAIHETACMIHRLTSESYEFVDAALLPPGQTNGAIKQVEG